MKRKFFISIIATVLFLNAILSSCALRDNPHPSDPGIDSYFKQDHGRVTRGYMRIEGERSKFSLNEEIRFTGTTTYDTRGVDLSAAYEIRFVVAHCEYVQVNFDIPDITMLDISNAGILYDTTFGHKAFCCSTTEFDESDLVYDPKNMPYSYDFTVQVLPDAPEEFGGKVEIHTYACLNGGYDENGKYLWDDQTLQNECKIWFYRTGDQIFFSDRSVEDAKLRAKNLG